MPDFTVKPVSTNSVTSFAGSYVNSFISSKKKQLTSAYNNFMGITEFIGETNVFDILNCVEEIETSSEYGYTQQKGIGQKPKLVYTGEGLKQYSLNVKLNHKFCRPDYIIEQLKAEAALHTPFSYFQGDEYIGEYVITRVAEKKTDTYKSVTLNAELTVDILECPSDEDEEFEQQTKTNPDIPADAVSVTDTAIKTPVDVAKDVAGDVFSRLTEKAMDEALRSSVSYINGSLPNLSILLPIIGGLAVGILQ